MAAESCNKEKEALAAAQKDLRNERFKWKMIALGLGILAILLLISTLYFWWGSSEAPAAAAAPADISSVAATAGTPTDSISPELR